MARSQQDELKNGKAYWRSLNELADSPEFLENCAREFPGGLPEPGNTSTRREFLRLMSASLALAGITLSELTLSSCRWPKEKILPENVRPEGRMPGVPVQYATSMEIGGVAHGLLATSYDGRPIKVDGNPKHPFNEGASSAIHQASILELYDPERSKSLIHKEREWELTKSWTDFYAFCQTHFASLKKAGGEGFHVLSEASSSVSYSFMLRRLKQAFPMARFYEYEPISYENELLGAKLACNKALRPLFNLKKAKVILSLDSDFLMAHPCAIRYSRDFAALRKPEFALRNGGMNRLYVLEPSVSVTGAMADRRMAMPVSDIWAFALALAGELCEMGLALPEPLLSQALEWRKSTLGRFANDFLSALAKDLYASGEFSLITAGASLPAEVHALVLALNSALGAVGNTVEYLAPEPFDQLSHLSAIKALTEEISNGNVKTLLILGGNPAYDAPADLAFDSALEEVPTSIHLSLYRNETSKLCTWHLPRAHYLESWGDARAYDGTVSLIQPLIEPLYGGKTREEVLALILDEEPYKGYEIVRQSIAPFLEGADFEKGWRRALHDGIVPGTAWPKQTPTFDAEAITNALSKSSASWQPLKKGEFEISFRPDYSTYDGRFANNGWLQELPDPITKITWDNALLVSPGTAKLFALDTGDVVEVHILGRRLAIPVYILPGQADNSLTLPLGYGRSSAGRVGDSVGANSYIIRGSDSFYFAKGALLVKTMKKARLATTQEHHAIDLVGFLETGRRVGNLIREGTLSDYLKNPRFAQADTSGANEATIIAPHKYEGYKWGMVIDLSVCTGCSACVTACQAENNIPIVGKAQVLRGREMHWIRVDRYFSGEVANPSVRFQPLTCHQCENAPCEQVCPVAATQHSAEGLNEMVYNRCIGTRYCSNNCPYKVRRFNFFNYHKNFPEVMKLLMNPEVTVRSRGVMEKCTFCIQRIQSAKIKAKNEGRTVRDGEITPACAQACPTSAIVFGDLNDENSEVRKLADSPRAYQILSELNVKPRTSYLARIRNI